MEHAKMIRTARGLATFFKVMQRISLIAIAVMLVLMTTLTIVNAVQPGAVIGEDFQMVDVGMLTIELAGEHLPDNATVLKSAWVMVAFACMAAGVMAYVFGQLRKLMAPMQEGKPFCEATCKALRRLADSTLVMGILGNVGEAVVVSTALGIYQLDSLPAGGKIVSLTANYTFELDFLLVYFLLLLVGYIFRYGMQLQQLSDETL